MLIAGEDEYIVEEILNSHMQYNGLGCLVKWMNYNNSYNSWEVHQMSMQRQKQQNSIIKTQEWLTTLTL
jgi:hypothetical protein